MAGKTYTWNTTISSGTWGTAADWNTTGGATVPGSSNNNDTVIINTGTVQFDQTTANNNIVDLTLGGNATAFGTLVLNVNSTLLTVANNTNLNNGGTIVLNASGGSGNLTTGVLNINNGTINLESGNLRVGTNLTLSAGNLNIFNLSSTINGTLTDNGTLNVTGGTLNLNGGTLNVNNAGSGVTVSGGNFNQSGGTATIGNSTGTGNGNLTVSGGVFNQSAGTMTVGNVATFTGGTDTISGSFSAKTLNVGASAGTAQTLTIGSVAAAVSVTGATTIQNASASNSKIILQGGSLTITGGLSFAGTGQMGILQGQGTVSGGTISGTGGTINASNGKLTISDAISSGVLLTVDQSTAFNSTLNINGTATSSSTIALGVANATLEVGSSGNLTITGAESITGGNLVVDASGALRDASGATMSSGNFNVAGTANLSGGDLAISGGALRETAGLINLSANNFNVTGSGAATLNGGTFNGSGALKVDGSTAVLTMNGVNMNMGAVNVNQGTLNFTANTSNFGTLTVQNTGNLAVSGGTFNTGGSAVTFNGTGALNLNGTGTLNGNGTLSLASNSTTLNVNAAGATLNGYNVNLNQGNLNFTAGNANIAGVTLGNAGANLTIAGGTFNTGTGSLSVTAGTFNERSGTVNFNVGNASFSGGTDRINSNFTAIGNINIGTTLTIDSGGNLKTIAGTAAALNINSSSGNLNLNGGTVNLPTGGGTISITNSAVLFGFGTVNGALAGNGTVEASGGTLDLKNALTVSTLTYEVASVASSDLQIDAGVSTTSEIITFLGTGSGAHGEVALGSDTTFHGTISQLTVGTANMGPTTTFIDIVGNSTVRATVGFQGTGAAGTIMLSDGSTLTLANIKDSSGNPYSGTWYADAITSGSDTEIFLATVPCYAAGTLILAERGEVAVENLAEGERIVTLADGVPVLKAVTWIGRRRLDLTAHPRPETVMPVRIAAGAIADGMPRRDLVVSPDHAIFIDGLLIQARQLVNGTTVRQESDWTAVEYFHVELDRHAIMVAEGLPAESYLRSAIHTGFFQNGSDPLRLHPDLLDNEGLPERVAGSCVPFAWDEPRVMPVWHRLADRAAALGRPVALPQTTMDPALRLAAKGRQVKPIYGEDGLYIFPVPRGAEAVHILSRSATPTESRPWLEDRRMLGVRITRLVLRSTGQVRDIPLDHPALTEGWWDIERDGGALRRWTGGDARLPLPPIDGPAMLEIHASGEMRYAVAEAAEAPAETGVRVA